jgi:type IX secretion system PorP/SprF family membrane protein
MKFCSKSKLFNSLNATINLAVAKVLPAFSSPASTNMYARAVDGGYWQKGLFGRLFCCKTRWVYLFLGGMFFSLVGLAQDIHLSQFFNTPLLRNPALAGVFTGDLRLQAVYRNQWQTVGFPYQTNAFSAEYKFGVGGADDYMTLGISMFSDEAGSVKLKTLQVMPAINFHKSLSGNKSSYLNGGFMAGYVSRQFDGKNLTFDNQYTGGRFNASAPTGENFSSLNRSFFDIALGLSYNSQLGENGAYYAGVSLWHFNKPATNFLSDKITLQPKIQFNAGVRTWVAANLELTVEANYLKQGPYTEAIGGAMVRYDLTQNLNQQETAISTFSVGGGAFVRLNDAVIPYVQVSYNHFDVGLSYDVNTSPLKAASQGRGGFEMSLTYRAFTKNKGSSVQSMRCPRF